MPRLEHAVNAAEAGFQLEWTPVEAAVASGDEVAASEVRARQEGVLAQLAELVLEARFYHALAAAAALAPQVRQE